MFSISVDASLTKASSTGSLIQVGNAIQLLLRTCELATNILRSPTNISFSQQISKRFGKPRWERSSSWFPGEAIPLQMPGGQKTKQKMPGSYCLWSLWSSNCRWRVAQRRLNARTNAGRQGTENQLMGQFQQCHSFIFILGTLSIIFNESTRCRADCKNSMGFKELAIHTGSFHNTLGVALKRGAKK